MEKCRNVKLIRFATFLDMFWKIIDILLLWSWNIGGILRGTEFWEGEGKEEQQIHFGAEGVVIYTISSTLVLWKHLISP